MKWIRVFALALILMMLTPAFSMGEAVYTTANKEYENLSEEGTLIQGDGYQIELRYCGPEGKRVFGRLYYPEDFDASRQYCTIVMNHGGGDTADFWDKFMAPYLTKRGYICYAIVIVMITAYSTLMIYIIRRFFPFILGKPFKLPRKKMT